MKKVFRISKFIENMYEMGYWWMAFNTIAKASWPKECDGKTLEEIHELGYEVLDFWLVEEEG